MISFDFISNSFLQCIENGIIRSLLNRNVFRALSKMGFASSKSLSTSLYWCKPKVCSFSVYCSAVSKELLFEMQWELSFRLAYEYQRLRHMRYSISLSPDPDIIFPELRRKLISAWKVFRCTTMLLHSSLQLLEFKMRELLVVFWIEVK